MVRRLGDAERAGGVESPFQDRAVDDERARERPLDLALSIGPSVHDQCAAGHRLGRIGGAVPAQAGLGRRQDLVDLGLR